MDRLIADFINITNASPEKAEAYLRMSDGDVNQAIHLFFETDGADLDPSPTSHNVASHAEPTGLMQHDPITVDDDIVINEVDDDFQVALQTSRLANQSTSLGGDSVLTTPGSTRVSNLDTDEAMARRLQEEFYSDMNELQETNGVRAPIAKTRETLVGPEDDYLGQMDSQLRRGSRRSASMFSDCFISPLSILTTFQQVDVPALSIRDYQPAVPGARVARPGSASLKPLEVTLNDRLNKGVCLRCTASLTRSWNIYPSMMLESRPRKLKNGFL